MKINNNIKIYREEKKLFQKSLAEYIGISERQLIRIEKGEQDPRTSTSLKIAKVLNTTVEQLFPVVADDEKILITR